MSDDFEEQVRQAVGRAPDGQPIDTQELGLDDEFQFDCHKGVSCFKECCRNINVTLTPYDIIRLARRLETTTDDFLTRYTQSFPLDDEGTPGVKLRPQEGSNACQLLGEEGCTVYEDRPAACRYYALGNMSLRREGSAERENVYLLVKEPHCKGHEEPRRQTVREYRQEQGCDVYDDMNAEWFDLMVKKRSGEVELKQPTAKSHALFYMASYNLDRFRRFALSERFNELLDVDEETQRAIEQDDVALLRFAMLYLDQVLYGEDHIPLRDNAQERRLAQRAAEQSSEEQPHPDPPANLV